MADQPGATPDSTGRAIEGTPWEEPRGPHLPDAMTRQSRWVWPFLALAAFQAWLVVDQVRATAFPALGETILRLMAGVPGVVAPLLGAAFFARHPDGWTAHRAVAIAVTLLAIERLLRSIAGAVDQSFASLGGLEDGASPSMLFSTVYGVLVTVIGIGGLAYLWVGLTDARRYADVPGTRPLRLLVLASVPLTVVLSLAGLATLSAAASGFPLDSQVVPLATLAISLLAAAVVTAELVAGWRAGERPALAWRLAATGGLLTIAATIATGVLTLVGPGLSDFFVAYLWANVVLTLASSLLWLAAFALGLPSDDGREPAAG